MKRYRALQILLAVLGLGLIAGLNPLIGALRDGAVATMSRQDQMISTIYVVLGIFLVAAARNPRAHRSLVLFAGWSSLAHLGVMTMQGIQHHDLQRDAIPFGIAAVVAVVLLALSSAVRPTDALNPADAVAAA